ncbi:hypothetical protein [Azospirillum rugosum]|uniref:Uncharacterized protein n=1 Tax=Azospirillum rugosum TaxID=416170 RepID=A0ABS4SIT9_9PROT|nr:hypothetical protein [Azospirillum rugosum]MBP2291862.1 hypothetical protein [Azospirillum rugosum]MDQ0524326.1 hypothetical protein [Azospirillum rugosum]
MQCTWLADSAGTTRRLVLGQCVAVVWLGETDWKWLVTAPEDNLASGSCKGLSGAMAAAEQALHAAVAGWSGHG